ncbi:unnamed protein product, partial [Schistosoma haematobium]
MLQTLTVAFEKETHVRKSYMHVCDLGLVTSFPNIEKHRARYNFEDYTLLNLNPHIFVHDSEHLSHK